jgi:flavodoxin
MGEKKNMRILIVYYSRTGITKKVAFHIKNLFSEIFHEDVQVDTEEIIDKKNRKGMFSAILGAIDAFRKNPTQIKPINQRLQDFDLVIVGTPVWASTVPSSIRTFFQNYASDISQAAFFCTMGSSGDQKTFAVMEKLLTKPPIHTMSFKVNDVKKNSEKFSVDLGNFVKDLIP